MGDSPHRKGDTRSDSKEAAMDSPEILKTRRQLLKRKSASEKVEEQEDFAEQKQKTLTTLNERNEEYLQQLILNSKIKEELDKLSESLEGIKLGVEQEKSSSEESIELPFNNDDDDGYIGDDEKERELQIEELRKVISPNIKDARKMQSLLPNRTDLRERNRLLLAMFEETETAEEKSKIESVTEEHKFRRETFSLDFTRGICTGIPGPSQTPLNSPTSPQNGHEVIAEHIKLDDDSTPEAVAVADKSFDVGPSQSQESVGQSERDLQAGNCKKDTAPA